VTITTPASAIAPPASVTAVGVSPSHAHATANATTGTAYRVAAAIDTSMCAHA
jgi:hypothetical protein